jgi:CBS domain-containing protein
MAETRRWSSLAPSSNNSMEALQRTLPVRLIMTPRKNFHTCRHDESLEKVVKGNTERFDHLPVTRRDRNGKKQIVGLIELINYEIGKCPRDTVNKHMFPLSEEIMTAAETGILDFVRSADTLPCRLILTSTGIKGLVSISDLQQLPVRSALFALITQVEMTMTKAIKYEFNNSTGWIDRLSQHGRESLDNHTKRARKANNEVDPIHMTFFSDKVDILSASSHFVKNRDQFSTELNQLRQLRNKLVHANEYAADRQSARNICVMVRKAEYWVKELNKLHAAGERG